MIVLPVYTVVQEAPGVFRWTHVWQPLTLGAIGGAVGFDFLRSAARSMTNSGTDGVGDTLIYEGSIDGGFFSAVALPIDELLNSPLVLSIGENVRPSYIRPHVTGGDGTTSLTVTFVLRRSYGG